MSTLVANRQLTMSRQYLGDFEHLVLLAVIRLAQDGFGLAIRDEIIQRTARDVSTGAVYTTLDRLERKGLVRSSVEQGTIVRDNRVRRRYEVTPAGRDAVSAAQRDIRTMSRGLVLYRVD
jgi:PadR family transcriptional regulator, regulatory protein PadR